MTGAVTGQSVGIDLGTTYSCVGVWQNDRVEIIVNDQVNRTTPSYVAFTDTEHLIGDAAKNQVTMNVFNTVFDAKRLIGRKFSDPIGQSDLKSFQSEGWSRRQTSNCRAIQRRRENFPTRRNFFHDAHQNERSRRSVYRIRSEECGHYGTCLFQRLSTSSNKRCWCNCWVECLTYHQIANGVWARQERRRWWYLQSVPLDYRRRHF